MFERFFSKPKEPDRPMICQFESDNNDCSLIQQLKEKQAELKEVNLKIDQLSKHSGDVLCIFVKLFDALEDCGLEMNSYQIRYSTYSSIRDELSRYGTIKIEKAIDCLSIEDIDDISNELKTLKERINNMENLKSQRAQLNNEITEIKNKLGIE